MDLFNMLSCLPHGPVATSRHSPAHRWWCTDFRSSFFAILSAQVSLREWVRDTEYPQQTSPRSSRTKYKATIFQQLWPLPQASLGPSRPKRSVRKTQTFFWYPHLGRKRMDLYTYILNRQSPGGKDWLSHAAILSGLILGGKNLSRRSHQILNLFPSSYH